MDLQGKLVVVTGAGKGIGRAIAAAFAAKGADLALLDVDATDLVASKALCEAQGVAVHTYAENDYFNGRVLEVDGGLRL